MKKILGYLTVLLAFTTALTSLTPVARADKIIHLIPIKGIINSRPPPLVGRTIRDAEHTKANAIILEITTFGGRLDAATKKKIVMPPGATIGAATPVDFLGKKASEKGFVRPWILWAVLAAVCVVIEIFTAGFFIFWFGVGAAAAATLAVFELTTAWQGVAFVVVSAICLLLSRRFAERITREQKEKVGPDRLIDKLGVVLEKIDPDTGKGKVRIESEEWRAISEEGEVIDAGAHVCVIKIEGTHLIVKRRKS